MVGSIVYGPVPSRRLGRSLGINNIPPKKCSYSCVYCQLGKTPDICIAREAFYEPLELTRLVREKVKKVRAKGEVIDYFAFVPDGEPTLDANLGKEIDLLQTLGIKIAVITNASLVWQEAVRQDLRKADWVCLKVDAVSHHIWDGINRPDKRLVELDTILDGIFRFARTFQGELTSETMLVKGFNDEVGEISRIANFLAKLALSKAYLIIPTRPPAERVKPASEQILNAAYRIFEKMLNKVEFLTNHEGNDFASSGNIEDDLLTITAVHPMREEAIIELLNRSGKGWDVVRNLINHGNLEELEYKGKKFCARKMLLKRAKGPLVTKNL